MLHFVVPVGISTGGLPFLPNPQVAVTDVGRNTITTVIGNAVTVSIETNPASGVLSGDSLSEEMSLGSAVFHNLKLDVASTGYVLRFTCSTLDIARNFLLSSPIAVGIGPVAKMKVTTEVSCSFHTVKASVGISHRSQIALLVSTVFKSRQ